MNDESRCTFCGLLCHRRVDRLRHESYCDERPDHKRSSYRPVGAQYAVYVIYDGLPALRHTVSGSTTFAKVKRLFAEDDTAWAVPVAASYFHTDGTPVVDDELIAQRATSAGEVFLFARSNK